MGSPSPADFLSPVGRHSYEFCSPEEKDLDFLKFCTDISHDDTFEENSQLPNSEVLSPIMSTQCSIPTGTEGMAGGTYAAGPTAMYELDGSGKVDMSRAKKPRESEQPNIVCNLH